MTDALPEDFQDFDDFEELIKAPTAAVANPCTLRVGTMKRAGRNNSPKLGLMFRLLLLPEDVARVLAKGPRFSVGYSPTGRVLQLRAHAEGRYELAKMPRSTHTFGLKAPFPSQGIRYEEGQWSVMPVVVGGNLLRIPVPEALHPRSIAHLPQPDPEATAATPTWPPPEPVPERVGQMRLTPTERTILGCFLARASIRSSELVEIVRSCGGAVNSAESAGTLAERFVDRFRSKFPEGVRIVGRNGGYDMPIECKPILRNLIRESGS